MPILTSGSVTLDGSGNGSLRLSPVPLFRAWEVQRISLSITGGESLNVGGEARVFRNSQIPGDFIDGTSSPWNDVYAAPLTLLPPEAMLIVFTSCGASQRATVTVEGVERGI